MPKAKKETVGQEEVNDAVSETEPTIEPIKEQVKEPDKSPEPKQLTIESTIEGGTAQARVYPQIRVGVCEFHGTPYGVVDKNTLKGKCMHSCKTDPLCPHSKTGCPWEESYTLKGQPKADQPRPIYDIIDGEQIVVGYEQYCRHEHNYKNLMIRCTYCPKDANMRGTVFGRVLAIFGSPDDENKLIVCCSDYRCRTKHIARFQRQVV